MKILYCIPSLYNAGGMERVISEKANYFADLPNYDISIVTTDQQGKAIRFPLDKRIRLIHLNIDFNAHFTANLFKQYILHNRKLRVYKKQLSKLIKEIGIDICISLCGKEIEFIDKMDVQCKKIAELHFSMNYRKQFLTSRHTEFWWKILGDIRVHQFKKAVRGLDKLIVLTKNDRLQWEQTHLNILQIPNPNPLQNDTISTLEAKRVISVGRLDAQKGYDMLVDTWALVNSRHPDWVLDIFGEGEWELMLTNRINKLNLTEKIKLCGLTSDVMANYLESSIYVMSSRYEGFAMVLIEAMSCGLPVVSFNCECGPSEIITNGVNGFLIAPNNIQQLAHKICLLIENEAIRKQMGIEANKSVNQYLKETVMLQWVELFDCILQQPQKTS